MVYIIFCEQNNLLRHYIFRMLVELMMRPAHNTSIFCEFKSTKINYTTIIYVKYTKLHPQSV